MFFFQIAKNLVYLFDAISYSDEDLFWLCHRLSVLCNFELVKLPAETIRVSRFSYRIAYCSFFLPIVKRFSAVDLHHLFHLQIYSFIDGLI